VGEVLHNTIRTSDKSSLARWYEHFHTKNHNSGLFWRALEWKMLVYFMKFDIVYVMSLGTFYAHLLHFVVNWCIFARFGML
jgi:hypothetical protein